ncbi:tRNA epoxyqueuosine(34) reductase QueG [Melioribacteraceae bacterium 4301-Me]|uniref:tRNA epoxyqueuosine(34) reductase QueG n=1 Tax=Pyranulibacter aquaticus TaxID=3163344 RepID=UPI003597DC28
MQINNKTVIEKAKELGFNLVGFAPAEKLNNETELLRRWLDKNYHATMKYMERNFEKRLDVKNILPNAKSVISLALNYFCDENFLDGDNFGKVSRYAWGKDYHLVMWQKLEELDSYLRKLDSDFEMKFYVDAGPVMDKAWAVKAGIGWLGKHTNVISREFGSWIFLATCITNVEFEYNLPSEDYCGTCTACIDACPTNAIIDEYIIDANKCISFLTIENKGEIPDEFNDKFEGWIFGCDICQEVCPWNKKFSIVTNEKEFGMTLNKELNLDEILTLDDEQFKIKFANSPIKRAKLTGLKRNAQFLRKSRIKVKESFE